MNMNSSNFKGQGQAWLDIEDLSLEDYRENHVNIIQNLDQVLSQSGMSDHGMFDFLIDLWDQLYVSF